MDYSDIPPAEAYRLLNTGGLVLVCTRGSDGRYDLAPVAWNCPLDYDPVSRVLVVMDPGHRTVANIEAMKEFALALPTWKQRDLVERAGSASGREVDKYREFGIRAAPAATVDALVPEGVAAKLECRLFEIHRIGSVALIAGEVIAAAAAAEAWKLRLHMTSGESFYRPGELVD
jgi:flavin reductase (DIM6/NTAB) family NADH-FMN oxidoreductase RutF